MNDQFIQQSLLQLEVTPAPNLWEQIAYELDQQQADAGFAGLLQQVEVSPPAESWQIVAAQLGGEAAADKFLSHLVTTTEVEPPSHVWQELETKLIDNQLKETLVNAEEHPPTAVWNSILRKISQPTTGKLIVASDGFRRTLRIVAAAAITGLIIWGSSQLLNKPEPIIIVTTETEPASVPPNMNLQQKEMIDPTQKDAIKPAGKNQLKITKQPALVTTAALVADADHSSGITGIEPVLHHKKRVKKEPETSFEESQYLLVMDEKGDLIRVPKKLSQMKCVSENKELPVDAVAALQSRNCDDQIKKWQQKMAMSAVLSPVSGSIDMEEIIRNTER